MSLKLVESKCFADTLYVHVYPSAKQTPLELAITSSVNWSIIEMSNSERHKLNRLARAKVKAKQNRTRSNATKTAPSKR